MYGHRSSRLRFGVDLDRNPSFLALHVAQKSLDYVRSSNPFLTAVSELSRSSFTSSVWWSTFPPPPLFPLVVMTSCNPSPLETKFISFLHQLLSRVLLIVSSVLVVLCGYPEIR